MNLNNMFSLAQNVKTYCHFSMSNKDWVLPGLSAGCWRPSYSEDHCSLPQETTLGNVPVCFCFHCYILCSISILSLSESMCIIYLHYVWMLCFGAQGWVHVISDNKIKNILLVPCSPSSKHGNFLSSEVFWLWGCSSDCRVLVKQARSSILSTKPDTTQHEEFLHNGSLKVLSFQPGFWKAQGLALEMSGSIWSDGLNPKAGKHRKWQSHLTC